MEKSVYDTILEEAERKVDDEARASLTAAKRELEEKIIGSSLKEMQRQGHRRVVVASSEQRQEGDVCLRSNPSQQVSIDELRPYCDPKLYQQYMDTLKALRELESCK